MIDKQELLNLTEDEKLAIIDLLQKNLWGPEYEITQEQRNVLEERIEKIEKGESRFYSLKEFQQQLAKRKK